MGSFVWLRSKWASSDGALRRGWFSISCCWSPLNVTTPIDCDARSALMRTTGSDEAGSQSKNDARVYYIAWFCYISLRQLRPL